MNAEDLVHAKGLLEASKWHLLETVELGLLPDGELKRYVVSQTKSEADAVRQLLLDYADAANYTAPTPTMKAFVDSPWVRGDLQLEGRWRTMDVEVARYGNGQKNPAGQEWRVIQTLRKGLLTSLTYADARLVQVQATPGDGATNSTTERYLTLEWRGVDPDQVQALTAAKAVTTVVADLAHRKVAKAGTTTTVSVTGDWHPLASTAVMEDDGSATIRWLVADPEFILVAFADWLGARQTTRTYYWNIPQALSQGVIDAAKAKGVSVSASYDAERGLVDITVDVLDLTGETIADVKVGENCDSTEYASFAFAGGDSAALPIPGSITAGTSYDRNLTINGDGSYNIVLRWKVRKYRDITEYDSEFRADQGVKTKEWKGWTNQNLGTALNSQTGKVVQVRREVREDCSVDIERRVITPANQASQEAEARADQYTNVVTNTQSTVVPLPGTFTPGTIVRTSARPTEFGRFATREEIIDAMDQTTTSGEVRHDQSSVIEEHTQAEAEEAAPTTPVAGSIVRVQNRETEFGLYTTRKETIEAAAKLSTGWFPAGSHEYGSIYKLLAVRQTEAEARAITGTAYTTAGYQTTYTVSGPDGFGLFDVSGVAVPKTWTVSITRRPYDNYKQDIVGVLKTQYRQGPGGVTQQRTLTLTQRFAGNVDESTLADNFELADGGPWEGVQINPNATGTYFQGQGYKITGSTLWTNDEEASP